MKFRQNGLLSEKKVSIKHTLFLLFIVFLMLPVFFISNYAQVKDEFEDGTGWTSGDFVRPDPNNPKKFVSIESKEN